MEDYLTIRKLKELIDEIPNKYWDSKVIKTCSQCPFRVVGDVEFKLRIDQNGADSYLELD